MTIDSRTIQDAAVSGLAYSVEIVDDSDMSDVEGDGCTPRQISAFRRGDWQYVGVLVTPVIDGDPIETARVSLWGVEYGDYLLTDEHDNEVGRRWLGMDEIINEHPVPEMLDEVKDNVLQQLGPKIDALRAVYLALPVPDSARFIECIPSS